MEGRTVLATGVFDIIHPGHLKFLQESRKLGGPNARLVVVVARDKTVMKRKGRRPVIPEQSRREMVAALKPVDQAILGQEEADYLGILRKVKPDVVCVGYDQNAIKKMVGRIVKKEKLPIRVLQVARFGPKGLDSSTRLKRRVLRRATTQTERL